MLKRFKYMSLLMSVAMLSGCCLFSDYMSEPDGEFTGTVPIFEPEKSYTPDNAVNRMITSLSIKCLGLFGGRAPIVKKEFSATDDAYNSLPDRVYHSLTRSGDLKAYYKGMTSDEEFVLKSVIESSEAGNIWSLKLIDTAGKELWKQKLLLKM